MAVTSRFTTFLQHSTRDLLAALERAGCTTRLLIEELDHGLIPRHSYMEVMAEFQPDLVVTIDHHRHEVQRQFSPNVPYLCWLQDEMINLYAPGVGDRLGPLDFSMGYGYTRCVTQYGYPADRFFPCRVPVCPERFAPRPDEPATPELACDVAYVSHQSEPPEQLHQRVREHLHQPHALQLIDAFYEQTRDLLRSSRFNAGFCLDQLLRQVETRIGLACEAGGRERLMSLYIRPLVDRTLRHVTLEWVADWAEATGRRLHLYGRGWEAHPRFAAYARGPARHGQHLAQIARSAAINLHMGLNLSVHQRVLETLCAGGLIMARYHPFDFYHPGWGSLDAFLQSRGIDRPTQLPMSALPPDYVQAVRESSALTDRPVPEVLDVTQELLTEARARRHWGQRYEYANLAFPGFEEVTFNSPESFAARAEELIADPDRRRTLIARMQTGVTELFTYDALVQRLLAFLRDALTR